MEENDNLVSRATYKHIKSLNRTEMSAYLTSLCEEAAKEYSTVNLNELRQIIGSVNGIGEKRLNEIMSAIAEYYNLDESADGSEE